MAEDKLKDAAASLAAGNKAMDVAAAPKPSLFHKLIASAGVALVGIVDEAARLAILGTIPGPWQRYALDIETAASEWIAGKIRGADHGLSHETVVSLHGDLAIATDAAIATFVAPKLGASAAGVVGKIAHGLEDAATAQLVSEAPPEPHL